MAEASDAQIFVPEQSKKLIEYFPQYNIIFTQTYRTDFTAANEKIIEKIIIAG